MTFEEYIPLAMATAVFKDPFYPYASLLVESAELLDVFVKPLLRGDNDGQVDRDKVVKEAGDCLWMLAAICQDHVDAGGSLPWEFPQEYLEECSAIDLMLDNFENVTMLMAAASEDDLGNSAVFEYIDGYMSILAEVIYQNGITIGEVLDTNLSKLRSRAERGVLTGSGGER